MRRLRAVPYVPSARETRALPRALAVALTLVLALVLAACAPAAGRQSSAPVQAGAAPVPVERGETIYVRVDYTLDAFGLTPRDLTPSLWVPSGYASEVGDVSSYFGLHDVDVAAGWSAELSRMRIERRTTSSTSFGTSSTTVSLWAEIKVTVAADAIPGVYRVRGTLQARGGARQPLAFRLDVAP